MAMVVSWNRAIAEKSRTVRLPIHVNKKLNQIKKVQRELFQTLGRRGSLREIAQKLDSIYHSEKCGQITRLGVLSEAD